MPALMNAEAITSCISAKETSAIESVLPDHYPKLRPQPEVIGNDKP
jgi:hypothetical protein